ncbi:MAG: CBASS cGAMP-activated phospholipase [Acidobacteriota bacterium]
MAIDGGGMRGLYSATLLDTLACRYAREAGVDHLDVGRGFDLIAGTSTGGLLACALAAGIPTQKIADFYRSEGPKVFSNPVPSSAGRLAVWALRAWKRPANPADRLRAALEAIFGQETLAAVYDRRGIALAITAVNFEAQAARVFKTPHHAPLKQRDNNFTLRDVCLATSAAPIYLPPAFIDDPDAPGSFVLVDGGLWANNPTLVALIEALATAPPHKDIVIISIGTSPVPTGKVADGERQSWGLADWRAGTMALSTALNVQTESVESIVRLLLPHLERRCEVVRLPATAPSAEQARLMGLDQASRSSIQVLESLGKRDADLLHSGAANAGGADSPLHSIFQDMPALPK